MVMSTVKFINEIIEIYFSARTFHLEVDQCFHWCMGVHIFGDAKKCCPNLILFFPNHV